MRWDEAVNKAAKNLGLDPRLVALVRFLARRAAEADYEAERALSRDHAVNAKEKEDHR